jgi:hypothetical protein
MPATGPEFTRRVLLLGVLAARLRADSADEVWDVLSAMATDLSEGHPVEFLRAFDPAMPGFEELRINVTALVAQEDVQSSIDVTSNEGDNRSRKVEADWLLRMIGREQVSGAMNREERVKIGFEKQGKRWRAVSLEPLAFFAPPKPK